MKSTWQRRSEQMEGARMIRIIYWLMGLAMVLSMGIRAIG